jgi:hypothetical protein
MGSFQRNQVESISLQLEALHHCHELRVETAKLTTRNANPSIRARL